MRRARLSGVMIGLVVVLVNVALVVGLVIWLQGSTDLTAVDESSSTTTTSSSSPVTSEPPPPAPPRRVLEDDKDPLVVVLGGDEGVGEGGWVWRMATLATERSHRVTYSGLDPEDPTRYAEPTRTGEGGVFRVRNGSVSDTSMEYATDRLRFLVSSRADVVLISYHPTSTRGIDHDLDDLLERVRARTGDAAVALVLAPDAVDGSGAEVRKAQSAWAKEHRVPTINVQKAFVAADFGPLRSEWADSRLTEQGADLWARTVLDALLGPPPESSGTGGQATEPVPGTTAGQTTMPS